MPLATREPAETVKLLAEEGKEQQGERRRQKKRTVVMGVVTPTVGTMNRKVTEKRKGAALCEQETKQRGKEGREPPHCVQSVLRWNRKQEKWGEIILKYECVKCSKGEVFDKRYCHECGQCIYAPQAGCENVEKGEFYSELDEVTQLSVLEEEQPKSSSLKKPPPHGWNVLYYSSDYIY